MKKLGIIGAMEVENTIILNALKAEGNVKETKAGGTIYYEGAIGKTQVVLARSGVGKVNAALCAQAMILQFGADFIVNSGIAGAIGKGLGVLDVVLSSDAVYHDMDASAWGRALGATRSAKFRKWTSILLRPTKRWSKKFRSFFRPCRKPRVTSLRLAASRRATSLSRTKN